MELASFVQSALVEIVTGVKDANKRLRESIQGNAYVLLASSNAKDAYVDFDVAVTVSKTDSTTAGGGLQVAVFGMSAGGEERESETRLSHIRFRVFLNYEIK